MTTLANAHTTTEHVALQDNFSKLFSGITGFFSSVSRSISFARQCEAEFNRNGSVSPDTLKRLISEV